MMVLHMFGATIPGAAAMVERVSQELYKANTLADRFRRSGLGKQARQERDDALQRYHWSEIETMLAEYPDQHIEVADAKPAKD